MSKFKVGQKVLIKYIDAIKDGSKYPFGFVDTMEPFVNMVATIQEVYPDKSNFSRYEYYNGDPYRYLINLDRNSHLWHSSMFVPISDPVFINLRYYGCNR